MVDDRADQVATRSLTVAEFLQQATSRLKASAIDTPAEDARRLLCHVLGRDRTWLILNGAHPLLPNDSATFSSLLDRRITGEPVSRILGTRHFYGRPFALSAATLDPRPDSETLIDVALNGMSTRTTILDIGTGTGCLLLTLLAERPHAVGVGTDIAAGALETAGENARLLGVASRATFVLADGLAGALALGLARFDLVIANPPYIPLTAITGLAPEVRLFDPLAALDGGNDGLDHYRAFFTTLTTSVARDGLAPGCQIVLEIGHDQTDAVIALAQAAEVCGPVTVTCDLGGHPRCVSFVYSAG